MLRSLLTWPLRSSQYFSNERHKTKKPILGKVRNNRKLRLTREGKYFIGITLGIGLAAINTGNNLLYLLLGWLLSVIIASGIMSDVCLRGIRLARRAPKRIYANHPFAMEICATNHKRRLASFSLQVEDLCAGRLIDKRCYFLKIPEGKSQTSSYRHTIGKRGLYTFEGFVVSTKFPFGLFHKSRRSSGSSAASEILVFPATHPVTLPAPRSQLLGDNLSSTVGRRGEFFGLREYREGDDKRSIHWRSSAGKGKLLVREYEDESQHRVTLLIDNALPQTCGEEQDLALESAICLCASLAKVYLERGFALRLVGRNVLVPFAAGELQVNRVMRALALLPTTTDQERFSAELTPRGQAVLVVPKGIVSRHRPAQVSHIVEAS